MITVINPQGRATPFGTVPRQVGYTITAIFEVGVYDYDETFIVMPIPDAQTLLLIGDSIGMIEVTTTDADRVGEILAPARPAAAGPGGGDRLEDASTSRCSRRSQVERVAMAFALSVIVLVAAFNILSSLVMLVRSKTRDIAILRTMGATRKSLLKIFVTTGSVIGMLGTLAGLVARLPDPAVPPADREGDRDDDRAEPVGPRDPLPHRAAGRDRSVRGTADLRDGDGAELPRHALSVVPRGGDRSGAGAAL